MYQILTYQILYCDMSLITTPVITTLVIATLVISTTPVVATTPVCSGSFYICPWLANRDHKSTIPKWFQRCSQSRNIQIFHKLNQHDDYIIDVLAPLPIWAPQRVKSVLFSHNSLIFGLWLHLDTQIHTSRNVARLGYHISWLSSSIW
jgi:hypothetical protein